MRAELDDVSPAKVNTPFGEALILPIWDVEILIFEKNLFTIDGETYRARASYRLDKRLNKFMPVHVVPQVLKTDFEQGVSMTTINSLDEAFKKAVADWEVTDEAKALLKETKRRDNSNQARKYEMTLEQLDAQRAQLQSKIDALDNDI